jgi:hypothetical protein
MDQAGSSLFSSKNKMVASDRHWFILVPREIPDKNKNYPSRANVAATSHRFMWPLRLH